MNHADIHEIHQNIFNERRLFYYKNFFFINVLSPQKTEIKRSHQSWKYKQGGIKESLYFNAKVLMEAVFSNAATFLISFHLFFFLALSLSSSTFIVVCFIQTCTFECIHVNQHHMIIMNFIRRTDSDSWKRF